MPATGRPAGRPPLPRRPPTLPPAPPPCAPWRPLVKVWLAGLLSATGIGVLRDVAHNLVLSGGGLAGFVLLIALWACAVCQSLGFYLMHRQVRRARPEPGTAAPATAGVLVLGGAAMIALNTVLVSGEGFLPAFGPVSLIVLCSPYPIVFTLLTARRPVALAAALATAAAVGTTVLPLRSSQEHLVAGAWRTAHPSTPRSLVAAVDWPGGEQSALTARAFGTQVTVFFQDSTVDGSPDGVVTVSPAGTDPCRNVPVVVTYDTVPDQDRLPDGDTMIVARTGCTPAGRGAWWLAGTGFRGYAVVVEGVLVRVTVDDLRPDDDLAAVARSVHPLDDHQLWRYTGGWPGWVWVLT